MIFFIIKNQNCHKSVPSHFKVKTLLYLNILDNCTTGGNNSPEKVQKRLELS
jgi:hypothetical protein